MSGIKSGNRLYPSLECGFAKYPLVEVKSCTEVQYTFCKLSYNRPLYPGLFLESVRGSCGNRTQGSPPKSFVIWVLFGQVTVKQKQFSCLHKELK